MYDYKLLEALEAVVEFQTFEKAAHHLNITQSAVSQRVKLLEELTGNILLVRSNPPAATHEGLRYLRHLKQVKHLEKALDVCHSKGSTTEYTSLSLALNADSIGTWFFEVIEPFLRQHKITLDLHSADQEHTYTLLKQGQVLSFIGTQEKPFQGCKSTYLGTVRYGLFCSHDFFSTWFSEEFSPRTSLHAPALFYNRSDRLNHHIFQKVFQQNCNSINISYVPSTELFQQFVVSGFGYGALPEQQSTPLLDAGEIKLLDQSGYVDIDLFFHRWNLKSTPLQQFEQHLLQALAKLLRQNR